MSTTVTGGSVPPPTRSGIRTRSQLAGPSRWMLSSEGVALPRTRRRAGGAAEPLRDGARVVAGRGALLVGRFVLLVDDHEPRDPAPGRTARSAARPRTRASPDADAVPLVERSPGRQATVQHGHEFAEAASEAADRLRRERDLGHQHDRRPPVGQGASRSPADRPRSSPIRSRRRRARRCRAPPSRSRRAPPAARRTASRAAARDGAGWARWRTRLRCVMLDRRGVGQALQHRIHAAELGAQLGDAHRAPRERVQHRALLAARVAAAGTNPEPADELRPAVASTGPRAFRAAGRGEARRPVWTRTRRLSIAPTGTRALRRADRPARPAAV